MIVELLIFIFTVIGAYVIYAYKKIHWDFDKAGLKYNPGVPLFGNFMKSSLVQRHFFEDIDEVYKAFPEEKYVGYIEAMQNIILVRDPEIIKSITVKDFDHFVDHKQFFPEENDPMFGGSVLMMQGERWRHMRMTLSPAFTGSKMRHMMPFMDEIAQNVVSYLKENQGVDIDVGDLIRRYTNDVIASAGFGLQVNSFKDRDNEFFTMGQGLFNFTIWQRINMFAIGVFPELAKILGLKLFPDHTTTFFRKIVASTIDFRIKNKVERPDMIQLLIEASRGTLKSTTKPNEKDDVGFATVDEALKPQETTRKWTQDELAGQVFIFFVAGFESSATSVVMCVHELALHPEIQERLYTEIKEFQQKNGSLTYENIAQLKYLDSVLNETFRKWSAALIMDRTVTKDFDLPPPREGGKPYHLKTGDVVYNVVNSIHMDPKYFPDPEKFDPERFSEENRHKIKPFTFMPFGMGPRNCIGSRFAIMELKCVLYHIILNFKIVKTSKTTDPIELLPADFNIKAKNGSWVKFEGRN